MSLWEQRQKERDTAEVFCFFLKLSTALIFQGLQDHWCADQGIRRKHLQRHSCLTSYLLFLNNLQGNYHFKAWCPCYSILLLVSRNFMKRPKQTMHKFICSDHVCGSLFDTLKPTGCKKKINWMQAYERMTLLLTWFTTSINSFIMNLWSHL